MDRIPHIYHNTIYVKKLFEIIYEKHLNIKKMFNELALFNDIDKSKGYLLDLLGGNFKVLRNGLSDEEYRRILKFEISLLQFLGSPEEIQRILSEYFKLNKEEFRIIEKITLAREEYYIEMYTLKELEEMKLEGIEKLKISRR